MVAPAGNDDPTGSWQDTARVPQDELLAPSTQFVADSATYLGQGRDVGRRVSDQQVELFVDSGDVAAALGQQFTALAPEFIALHDVGASAALRLLASLAGAAGARVQRLAVRRQGPGAALAVLQFVEAPLADGTPVRIYASDTGGDAALRTQLAQVLLAHSRLGVLLVGELAPPALAAQLAPVHEALLRGPWPNRELLMVPLGASATLAAAASQLAARSGVAVRVTPSTSKPRQVWSFVGGAWNRAHAAGPAGRSLQTELARAVPPPRLPASEAATEPMGLDGLPLMQRSPQPLLAAAHAPTAAAPATTPPSWPTLAATPMPVPGATRWQAYVDRCAQIKGCLSACVFDLHTREPLAHAGGALAPERLAREGVALLDAMNAASRALGLGSAQAQAAITTPGHHLLLRPVPGHPGIAVHVVLQASAGNLLLARVQLERIAPPA